MLHGDRKLLPLICGLMLGALTTHFVHLTTRTQGLVSLPSTVQAPVFHQPAAFGVKPKQERAVQCSQVAAASGAPRSPRKLDVPGELFKRVRILCLIMTHPGNYASRAVAVNNTWARRCNRYAFVGSGEAKISIPLIRLNISEHHDNLWQKTWMSFHAAYTQFRLNDFDFVLKADDDTYVVMENLRLLLLPLDPRQPSLVGRRFRYDGDVKQPYMSGGAGYVVSRRAAQMFVERAVTGAGDPCRRDLRFSEDFMLGTCLRRMGVQLIDSRDSQGRDRFHPLTPGLMIGWGSAPMPKWMDRFNYFNFTACVKGCISSVSITFHYLTVLDMYKLEFYLYEMRAVGIDPTLHEQDAAALQKRLADGRKV